jgi:hypothetical protein
LNERFPKPQHLKKPLTIERKHQMGLTIHYSLTTRGGEADARNVITSLHQGAHDLPFKTLGDIVDLSGAACSFDRRERDDPLHWMLCQAEGSVKLQQTRRATGHRSEAWLSVAPSRIIGFNAWPGDGCEEANFGLCQYPEEIFSPSFGTVKTKLSGWHWHSFCKTQYASNPDCGGVANFLRCHLTVIALLDQAKKLGCLEEVSDEGGFWLARDVGALVKEIGSWNQMLAAFGGMLKDVLGDGLKIAISEYPNFEQLEAAGQGQVPPGTEALVRLIHRVVKEPLPA